MNIEIISIGFLWFIRTSKFVLFWIYLWQLKEYHIGRFFDHFKTHKGKQLLMGKFPLVKVVLLVVLLANYYVFPLVFYILLLIYFAESAVFILGIFKQRFLKPVFTKKTVLLTLCSFLLVVLYLFLSYAYAQSNFWFTFYLLVFDILTSFIVSIIVLFFQPFFVLARNKILKKASRKINQYKKLTIIGINGSYGKTSTKEFLTTILSSRFNVLSTPDHKNSEIGIAQTILSDLNENHQIFIVEMGSYNKGGIKLLCNMVKPRIGIVTGVNEQHLALFGSLENLLSAEGGQELLYNLPKDGLLVVNGDNKYCMDLYKKADTNKKVYSLKNDKVDSDIWAEEISVLENSLDFMAMTREKEAVHFNVDILGKQNIQNLLGAILVAKELGMSLEEISEAAKGIQQEQAGITLKRGVHGINIIDSSYSSNPDGAIADLDYLNVFKINPSTGLRTKKVVIMPCLIELGKKSTDVHLQIGKKIAEVCDVAIITTKDKFEEVKNSAVQNGMTESKIIFCEKPKEVFHLITTFCKQKDVVLLEGRVPGELIKLLVTQKST